MKKTITVELVNSQGFVVGQLLRAEDVDYRITKIDGPVLTLRPLNAIERIISSLKNTFWRVRFWMWARGWL